MKSPISWQGGKNKMRKKIVSMFPTQATCYAETMVGAGWVFFTIKPGWAKTEYINDIDSDLVNFWRVVKEHKEEFIASFRYTPKSRQLFYHYRDCYASKTYANDIERAHMFFYLCKMGFGSRMRGPTFGTSAERASSLNYRTLSTLIDAAWTRLQDVMIDNKTYQEFIAMLDKQTTHFFIDPPYYGTSGYSTEAWDEQHFVELASICKNMQGTFLLTINDDMFIRSLFSAFNIHEHKFQYCISKEDNAQIVNELIITNYDVPQHTIKATSIEHKLTDINTTIQLF